MMEKEDETEPPTFLGYLANYQQRIRLRDLNFTHPGPSSEEKPRTAQIKAIQKFIVRLKSDNKNHEALLDEMEALNLSKYLEEISALMAVCVTERDIRFFSEVATRLNLDYENYPSMLLKDLTKQFATAYDSPEDTKPKLKALLLFTAELFVCGFTFPYREISEMLKKLVKAGTKKKSNFTTEKEVRLFAYYYNCDIYAAFLKHFGTIFTLSVPRWASSWNQTNEVPQYCLMIPAKTREDFTNIFFSNYITSCTAVLESAFERIKELEEQLTNNLKMSGQFNRQLELTYNELKDKFIFTKVHLSTIIDAMSSDLTLRDYQSDLVEVDEIMKKYINKVENVQIFENQFERELYTELPQISKTQNKAAGDEQYRTFKLKLDACKNKHESDQAIKAFELINNKRTRKLLSKDILEYRKEYQLVTPYLCRIATVVSLGYKDLTEWLLEFVFAEYEKLRESVSTTFVVNDKKSRNLKYICEFTKYKLIDPEKTIGVIQNLIDDLKGYNIELLISALESVGRFLYLAPLHANKFTFMLSKLQNVMKQKSLPLFTTSQLLNSINLLKPHIEILKPALPPPTSAQLEAERVLSKDIITEIEEIIDGIFSMVKTPEGAEAVKLKMLDQIESYDFLGNYNYAYLINELSIHSLTDSIVEETVKKLKDAVRTGNYQNCLLWSRFFAQLYKYELIKRAFMFAKLQQFLDLGKGEMGVINLFCTVLQTCHGYLQSKKTTTKNIRFLLLVQFKRYIHGCSYIPMLEEFKIIDVFEEFQPNLTAVKMEDLETFLQEVDVKRNSRDIDFSRALDGYLDKTQLKEDKNQRSNEPKDFRSASKQPQQEESSSEKNLELIASEARTFDSEFLNVMNSHIKDLSGKIAKPAFVEKVIERKKDRKKTGEGEVKRTVIGRCGNKFVKKEVIFLVQSSAEEAPRIKKEE